MTRGETMQDALTKMKFAQEEFEAAKRAFNSAEVDILKQRARELKEEYPELKRVGFRAHYDYDDEGSYYWYAEPKTDPAEFGEPVMMSYVRRGYGTSDATISYEVYPSEAIREDGVLADASVDTWVAATDAERLEESAEGWIVD